MYYFAWTLCNCPAHQSRYKIELALFMSFSLFPVLPAVPFAFLVLGTVIAFMACKVGVPAEAKRGNRTSWVTVSTQTQSLPSRLRHVLSCEHRGGVCPPITCAVTGTASEKRHTCLGAGHLSFGKPSDCLRPQAPGGRSSELARARVIEDKVLGTTL